MPEVTYRQILSDALIKSYLKTQFEHCLEDKAELEAVNKYTYFSAGALVGIVAGITLMVSSR